jgi:hypothetical protein
MNDGRIKRTMLLNRRTFLGAAGAAIAGPSLEAQNRIYTLEPDPNGKTLKSPEGRVVFTYLVSTPAGIPLAGNSACCMHPVNTPSGERVTDIAPPDHRDHRGIFFAWQDLEFRRGDQAIRGDFWGWGHFAPTEGRAIVNRNISLTAADAKSADVAIGNDWNVDGQKMLDEANTIHVTQSQGATVLDLTYRFSSDCDWKIAQNAFTGFAYRARKDGKWFYSDAEGKVSRPDSKSLVIEANWPARDWYSYTVTLENGKTVAIAVIDHPSNPPSTWHESMNLTYLNPCVSVTKPVTIPAGKTFALRYRALAHDGEFPEGMLNRIASEWRKA